MLQGVVFTKERQRFVLQRRRFESQSRDGGDASPKEETQTRNEIANS